MTREEAITWLKDHHSIDLNTQDDEAHRMAIKALEQTRWIPVGERLPEDGQKVLVTTQNGNIIDVNTCLFYHASAFWKHFVIAWMSLEPYKTESEEQE